MFSKIKPDFKIDINGFKYLGKGPKSVDGTPGWSRSDFVYYRCVKCGSMMQSSINDYFRCDCGAMTLDIDAGRFGSNYGDNNILVYKKLDTF